MATRTATMSATTESKTAAARTSASRALAASTAYAMVYTQSPLAGASEVSLYARRLGREVANDIAGVGGDAMDRTIHRDFDALLLTALGLKFVWGLPNRRLRHPAPSVGRCTAPAGLLNHFASRCP